MFSNLPPQIDLTETDAPNPQPAPEKALVEEMVALLKPLQEQSLVRIALAIYRNLNSLQTQKPAGNRL